MSEGEGGDGRETQVSRSSFFRIKQVGTSALSLQCDYQSVNPIKQLETCYGYVRSMNQ